jgi:membrane-bound lytic murein transglycosylase A
VPLGSVLLQQVSLPGDRHLPEMLLVGLAQDRGGAIKGDHLDLFCGAGEMAAFLAGHMKEKASVCILVSSGRLARK